MEVWNTHSYYAGGRREKRDQFPHFFVCFLNGLINPTRFSPVQSIYKGRWRSWQKFIWSCQEHLGVEWIFLVYKHNIFFFILPNLGIGSDGCDVPLLEISCSPLWQNSIRHSGGGWCWMLITEWRLYLEIISRTPVITAICHLPTSPLSRAEQTTTISHTDHSQESQHW